MVSRPSSPNESSLGENPAQNICFREWFNRFAGSDSGTAQIPANRQSPYQVERQPDSLQNFWPRLGNAEEAQPKQIRTSSSRRGGLESELTNLHLRVWENVAWHGLDRSIALLKEALGKPQQEDASQTTSRQRVTESIEARRNVLYDLIAIVGLAKAFSVLNNRPIEFIDTIAFPLQHLFTIEGPEPLQNQIDEAEGPHFAGQRPPGDPHHPYQPDLGSNSNPPNGGGSVGRGSTWKCGRCRQAKILVSSHVQIRF